jgi:hypothetical protein
MDNRRRTLNDIISTIFLLRYILNEVETCRHLISVRLYFILTILITEDDHNHIFLTIATQLVFFHNL